MPRYSRNKAQTERARALRRSTSKTERRLWPHLRGGALGASFRRQHPIGPYFADYACPALKVVVEVDGPDHDPARDARRDAFMAARGWTVLRFGVQAVVEETDGVVETIWRAVQE